MTLFNNIRKVLDDFENAINKDNNGEKLTREEETDIMQSNLRLAEALIKDWCGAERVAAIILVEREMLEKIEVKFNNDI